MFICFSFHLFSIFHEFEIRKPCGVNVRVSSSALEIFFAILSIIGIPCSKPYSINRKHVFLSLLNAFYFPITDRIPGTLRCYVRCAILMQSKSMLISLLLTIFINPFYFPFFTLSKLACWKPCGVNGRHVYFWLNAFSPILPFFSL